MLIMLCSYAQTLYDQPVANNTEDSRLLFPVSEIWDIENPTWEYKQKVIHAYSKIHPNLIKHEAGFPFLWFNYTEAGSLEEEVRVDGAENAHGAYIKAPEVEKRETIHFILKVADKGEPPLSRYKKIVMND